MTEHNEFWQRPVTDTLTLVLVPGEQPSLIFNHQGQVVLRLEFSEARALIEALTVAVGELLILKKDLAAFAWMQRLLDEDVTLNESKGAQSPDPVTDGNSSHVKKGHDLVRRYTMGGRSFPRADLRQADLQGADLREVDLSESDLSGANLKRANLFQANLEGANLSQVNFEEAGLFQANLRAANLFQASLFRAYLNKADLTGATVTDEQLAQVRALRGTVMPDGTKRK